MPKKVSKSGSHTDAPATPKTPTTPTAWKHILESINVVTEDWRCQVTMVVESNPRDTPYLDKFNKAAKDDTRMVIKSITYEETINMVHQIGSGKDIPPEEKIFELAHNITKQGNPIPEDILALIIKHQVLTYKANDIKIKDAKQEMSNGLQNESLIMMNKLDKQPSPTQDEKKFHTELRKLDEEWKDKVYIEDFPKDGPELYIAVIGFRKCKIIQELLKIKVPLVAVVKLESVTEPLIMDADAEINLSSSSSTHSKLSKFSPEIAIFWEDLNFLKSSPESSELKGVAFISFEPPYKETLPEGMNENAVIYDEISFLLYDIQDLTRQHTHYIDNIKIINVEETAPKIHIEDMTVYIDILESVPLECTTIAIMLYSMVAQVAQSDSSENSHNLQKSLEENKTRQTENLNSISVIEAQNKISEIFDQIKTTDNICDTDAKADDLQIIPWGDFLKLESYHCKSGLLDIRRITSDILSSLPVPRLWERLPIDKRDSEADFKLKLFHDCMHEHKISIESASRLLNLMCCKKLCEEKFFYDYQLYHKSMRKKRKPRRSPISPIPSSAFLKSASFTYGESPNVNHIESSIHSVHKFISNTECSKPSHFDDIIDVLETQRSYFETEYKEQNFDVNDYNSFEELTYESMLHALNKAYFEFNTGNIKYCPVTDKMIIVFFNKKLNGMNKFHWQRYIPSPVCLRDFFEYVFDEEYDWIVTEERIHDASLIVASGDAMNEYGQECIFSEEINIDYDKEMILKDSLKYSDELNSEAVLDKPGSSPVDPGKEGKEKNIKSTSGSTNKNTETSGVIHDEKKSFKFVGFNLGDDCVMTSGKSNTFFSKDGTAIFVDTYNNFDFHFYTSIRLITSNYDLFIHSSFDALTGRVGNISKIRLASKCGMNLIFLKSKTSSKGTASSSDIIYEPYHYLQFSWPNGLFVEPIWTQDSDLPLYIKQSILSKGSKCSNIPDELYRCYSINGEILVYKNNGDVQIFCPDSSIYLCIQSNDGNSFDARKEFKASIDEFLNADELFDESPSARPSSSSKSSDLKDRLVGDFLNYDATMADGSYFKVRNGIVVFEDKIMVRTAVDYLMGEVYSRRLDGTNVLLNKEGVQTTTFGDGSKISSYFILENDTSSPKTNIKSFSQNVIFSENDLINEHSLYVIEESTTEIDNDEEILSYNLLDDFLIVNLVYVMEHPNHASVVVNTLTHLVTINLPHEMVIQIEENGCYKLEFENLSTLELNKDELTIKDTKCFDCTSQSTTKINLANCEDISEILLTSNDCFNKTFKLNYFGECFLEESNEDCCNETKCDGTFCCRSLQRKDRRFFALKRDLSGEEYHHRETINLFKNDIEEVNWSSTKTDYDVFNPEITYDTIIFPVSSANTQAWIMEPLIVDVKPKNLTHADLKENKQKGIYAWMRPYTRNTFYYGNDDKKDVQPTPPKAMILRILRKLIPKDWNILKNMELVIERYICLTRKEKKEITNSLTPLAGSLISDAELAKVGHEMYDEILKSFDNQCVLSTARKSKDMEVQLNIKKFIEQRAKEKLMEEFYREALRTRHVPKYDYPTLNRESGGYAEEINIIEQ